MPPRSTQATSSDKLSPSAYVILGMLRLGARSGYEIKQIVEVSVRHFWTISYPQIYPELKRLQKAGLVKGERDAHSGRGRVLYKLTKAGEKALRAWTSQAEAPPFEARDLGLVRLMFADAAEPGSQVELIHALRARSQTEIERMDSTSKLAAAAAQEAGFQFPMRVVDVGVEIHRAIIRWCNRVEKELSA